MNLLAIILTFLSLSALTPHIQAQTQTQPDEQDVTLELKESGKVTEEIPVHISVTTDDQGNRAVTYSKSEIKNPPTRFTVDFDLGATNVLKNDVRIPNEGGTLISLKDTSPQATFRAYFTWAIHEHHSIRLLYAPFSSTGTFTPNQDIAFNGLKYMAGNPIEAYYQFNSYRIGYIYTFDAVGNFVFRVGFTNKIRDARIGLGPNAASTGNGFNDLGYVPLIHLGTRYQFLQKRAFADLEVEGLASPGAPGRAFEVTSLIGVPVKKKFFISTGYRFLEGGADVNIYNFAFLQTFFTRLTYQF
jgi:hypothetical protein